MEKGQVSLRFDGISSDISGIELFTSKTAKLFRSLM